MSTLISVGYGGRKSADDLITPLKQRGVKVLMDVRYSPRATMPFFTRSQLERSCAERGLRYVHEQALGNLNRHGDMGPDPILADAERGLSHLAHLLINEGPVAIMCACRREKGCHRELVIARLREVLGDVEVVTVA